MDWESIFSDLELATNTGIGRAIVRFRTAPTSFNDHETFWKEIFKRIDESKSKKFLVSLVETEDAGIYDIEYALKYMPEYWRHKISVKRYWQKFFKRIGQRFALKFTNHYYMENFFEITQVEDDVKQYIKDGILDGLSNGSNLVDASTFFGFVEIAMTHISPEQAAHLLDFALTRFELHIDDDYADGCWADWLNPPEDISKAFAGFIWTALGSPRAETRWQAAHCVRRLAEIGCEDEIEALIHGMEHDSVDAFGSHHFPFYNLHAKQYLLIALARVSIENPQILKHFHGIFSQQALTTISHALIQKFAAEIAINIEKAFPRTYSNDIIEQLRKIGVSQLPVKEIAGYRDKTESYWHLENKVDTSLKFHHGWDFDQYWFEPLGNVFGISGKQVDELANEVIINEWCVDTDGRYKNDPRSELWRSTHNGWVTRHDHGSYPRADDYNFYLSYHAMFVVAANLLDKMPVVYRHEWTEDEWAEWLNRHLLTRNDGYWLSDRRDPTPLLQREWIHENKTANWLSDITKVDFLDGIIFEREEETWLNVSGTWEEGDSNRTERFHIASALVSPAASSSLLNALTTCRNPYDFKLPDYQEEEMGFESYPFELRGWIWRQSTGNRLDEYDPFAAQITYPPYQIGESIVEKLQLSVDSEKRRWLLPDTEKAAIICELWSSNKPSLKEDPLRHGERLNASLSFLKNLCLIMECELIIEVQIDRHYKYKSYMENKNGTEYKPPLNKIYILSADGKLRDANTNYQLREIPG